MCGLGQAVNLKAAERMRSQPVSAERLSRAKRAFATRRIDIPADARLIAGKVAPRPGDLVLAQVGAIGHHARLELMSGRRATLHVGDEILVAYGDRYAPDQFEALTPGDLGPCNLVAGGGVASSMTQRAERARKPTEITPIGLVADAEGARLSTHDFALSPIALAGARPPTFAVLGTAMNSGKTATMGALARGETMAGRRVGAAKLTGTGSGGDLWTYLDAGAGAALDFTDAGHVTTYRVGLPALERIAETLATQLAAGGAEIVLLEISDGLLLEDTAALAASPLFRDLVDGVVFAATDSMGAVAGETWLRDAGHDVIAITGQLTRSSMLAAEAAQRAHAPVLTLGDISGGAWLPSDALGGGMNARSA
jgi:hypothetical protein